LWALFFDFKVEYSKNNQVYKSNPYQSIGNPSWLDVGEK
jgi:hypothetical protein